MNISKWLKYLPLFSYTTLFYSVGFLGTQSAQAQTVIRGFEPRYQTQVQGNISIIGNTLMTCDASNTRSYGEQCPNVQSGNSASFQGQSVAANNFFFMNYVDIDGNDSTFNSSSSQLAIPASATVAWAGLYWSGDLSAGSPNTFTTVPGQIYSAGQAAPNASINDRAQLQVPGSGYQTIGADNIDQRGNIYSAYADVTSLVRAAGSGNYTMADVQAGTGGDRYAGWSLIVIYEDPTETLRNLNVFDGFVFVSSASVAQTSISTTVSGFETPSTPGFEVELGAVSYEGDSAIGGDQFKLNGTNLSDGLNPANNFFNSSNTRLGSRFNSKNPDHVNQLAIDIDTVDATDLLNPGDTSALLEFTSEGDVYFPTALTFATEISQPVLTNNFTKTVVDLNGNITVAGDILEYEITVENTGNATANDVIISDPIPENTTLVDGSLEVVQDPNSSNIGIKTNAPGDDTAELSNTDAVFRVGTDANASNGGSLAPNESVTVKFQVQIDSQIDSTSNIENQASVDYNNAATGTAFDGVSDDPDTPQQDDSTNIQVTNPIACNGREILELSFQDPQLEPGSTALQQGATYRFANVITGVDALVTIDAFNNGASLEDIDNTEIGNFDAFQPELVPSTDPDSSVDFTISFVEGGANTPISINAFNASGVDIDGALNSSQGLNIREYIELEEFDSYLLENPTKLTATYNAPTGRFESATTETQAGIDVNATQNIVTGEFTNKSSFRYRIGALNSGNVINRLNSLSFNCLSYNNPQQNVTASIDYSDIPADGETAPDGSGTTGYGNATHIIVSGIQLGTNIDGETAAQNSANADGDDNDGTDDEDGVTIPVLTAGETATITANVSGTGGYLQGWIDWDGNGSFDTGEQVATDLQDNGTGDTDNTAGIISFDVSVPETAIITADTFGRFRWSTTEGLDFTTAASDGEVEDYQVAIATNSISGKVFEDFGSGTTGNNVPDASEDAIGDITLSLYRDDNDGLFDADDTLVTTTTSNSTNGNYSFDVNGNGTYFVVLDHLDSDAPNRSTALPDRTVRKVTINNNNPTNAHFPYDRVGTPFGTCPVDAFLFQDDPSDAYGVNLVTGEREQVPDNFENRQINGIGFNFVDKFIYGSNRGDSNNEKTIARVDSNYNVTILGPIDGLPAPNGYFVGDVSPDGRLYLQGRNNLFVVNVNPNSSAYLQFERIPLTGPSLPSGIADFAFNPIDEQIYTVNGGNGIHNLYRIDPDTGSVSNLGNTEIAGDSSFGAQFFDKSGFFYLSRNQDGRIFRIDIRNPNNITPTTLKALDYVQSRDSSINDGARCLYAPIDIDFGDAPESYKTSIGFVNGNDSRGAIHDISLGTSLYLGSLAPDAEIQGQPTAAADGDDNATAPNIDDEDGISNFPDLDASRTNYSLTATVNNTTGSPANVYAWIDFDLNGEFDRDERATLASNTGTNGIALDNGKVPANTSGQVTLNWSNIGGTGGANIVEGDSYLRIRFTTDTLTTTAGNTSLDDAAVGVANNGEVEDYQIAIATASDPNLLLVKRITAINPGQSDEVQFNAFIDDGTADNEDNDPNWPDNDNIYLRGEISVDRNVNVAQPGDEVEYTIYFLSNGDEAASNVQICDVIPDNMTYVTNSFGGGTGVSLLNSSAANATITSLSNAADTDEGTFFVPSAPLPQTGNPLKNLCRKVDTKGTIDESDDTIVEVDASNNSNGAVVVEIDNLPEATAPGTPANSYGFIRFRAKVK